jgi:tetratricopeptide (TPR) repeat protein
MNISEASKLAIKHYMSGNLKRASEIYLEVLRDRPDNTDALFMLGVMSAQKGNFNFAIECFLETININPAHIGAYYNLGNVYRDKGQINEAFKCYLKVIQLNPMHPEAYINLGIIHRAQRRFHEEIKCYQKAIQINPRSAEAFFNLGHAFFDKEQFDKALACYEKVIRLNPSFSHAYMNLGLVLRISGRQVEALSCYQKVIQINPDDAEAHWNLSNVLLLTGNFKPGWKEYMWLWKTEDYLKQRRLFSQPEWNGSDIKGRTILLYAEYGFGDTIQFIRFAPLVEKYGARVIVECQRELASLLQTSEGMQKVIPRGKDLPDCDIRCSLMMLPVLFDTSLETVPDKIPYLTANPALVEKWHKRLLYDNSKMKIGIVWSGVSTSRKFCSLDTFAPLAQLEGISFYSLQKGEAVKETVNTPKGMQLYDYTDEINDFSDTAALIENLDLVISIDTSVAHLAGALGKPVWTLLPFVPDWRWLLNREDSPWYPTMKLFRQPSLGDWKNVIDKVLVNLQKKLGNA